jgi:hypothetical protein
MIRARPAGFDAAILRWIEGGADLRLRDGVLMQRP